MLCDPCLQIIKEMDGGGGRNGKFATVKCDEEDCPCGNAPLKDLKCSYVSELRKNRAHFIGKGYPKKTRCCNKSW